MADPIPGWLVECWVLCAFSILIITTRVAISMNLRGVKGLLGDDYLSVITMVYSPSSPDLSCLFKDQVLHYSADFFFPHITSYPSFMR